MTIPDDSPFINDAPPIAQPVFSSFPPRGHQNCPICNYALTGLPARYKCPECGFEYDENTRVCIGEMRTGSLIRSAVVIVPCLLFSLPGIISWISSGLAGPPACSLILLGIAVFFLVSGVRRLRYRPLAVVNMRGIHHRDSMCRIRFVPWSDIHKVVVENGYSGYELVIDHPNAERTYIRKAQVRRDELEILCDQARKNLRRSRG